ncbi:carbohydrate binding domain-containing protein [bacterium]
MSGIRFFRMLPVLILLTLVLAYGEDTNILDNPGFERGRDGWFDRTCVVEAVTTPIHKGSGSIKALERTANWQGIKQSVFEKMIPGETYQISGWVRLDNATTDEVAVAIEQQDDSGTQYIGVDRAIASDRNWIELSGEFTLNVTGTLSVLDVYFEGPVPGVNFFVDDVNVYGPLLDAPEVIEAGPEGTGLVDVKTRHQILEGFGASGAYYTRNFVEHKDKTKLCDLLFKQLGLDIFRISNYYGIDQDNFNETIKIVKYGKAAHGDNLKIMISAWSPPAELKSNANTVGGTLKKNDGKYMYKEYAEWWYKSLKAYKKAGVEIDYINIQNELDYAAPWNSCQFAPTETDDSDMAAYDIAFETVWQKLNAEMGEDMPKMLAPEASGLGNCMQYVKHIDDLSHVYGFAHHLYDCSGCGSAPDRFIPRMISLNTNLMKYGDKPIFQTEYEDEPGTWDDALNTAHLIHNSFTIEKVSGYLYWDLFWAPYSGLVGLDDIYTYTIKPTYYTYKQFSAFVHAGWQRVETATDNTGLRISAFISPDNQQLTVVIINITDNMDVSLDLAVEDFSLSDGEIYRSSQSENCAYIGKYMGQSPLKIPASSVMTLALTAK